LSFAVWHAAGAVEIIAPTAPRQVGNAVFQNRINSRANALCM
jgi:hypothetical protein